MTLTSYPGTVRQLIVTGLGRDAPTVIITNDHDITAKALIEQYARRMTIEQRLAEIIRAFYADALSATVNLNVDLDVVLCVLAQALTRRAPRPPARLRHRHPRHPATPLPRHPRHHHHQRRHHHRPPRPPRLLTRPPPSRPPPRHPRPLVGKPPPPLPVRLAKGTIRCVEIRANKGNSASHGLSASSACVPAHCVHLCGERGRFNDRRSAPRRHRQQISVVGDDEQRPDLSG